MECAAGIGCERACSAVTPSRISGTESPYHASPLRVENSSSAMCLHSEFMRAVLNFQVPDNLNLLEPQHPGLSDAGVPGVAVLCIYAAEAFAKPLQSVGDRQVRDEFFVFVADLAREPHAKRSAVRHREVAAV